MEPARLLLLFSTLAFVGAVVLALAALRAGSWRESRWHLLPMALGFILQTAFLYLRGQERARCPLTNFFEVFIFIGWCIALLYSLVGATYRLSLLGVFTAPLLVILQTVALVLSPSWDVAAPLKAPVTAAGEMHKTVALIGYAAFAQACIAGVMFLVQERMLKRHRINTLFHQLPPIHDLSKAIARMMLIGVVLLGAALVISLQLHQNVLFSKRAVAWAVWLFYAAVLPLIWLRRLGARHTALAAIIGFAFVFLSIWIVAK